ncbi:probable serine carboxypeptidase CPVL [Octopus sinensis]|uniref:Probable serine carboxypeptidase CPVL n=1 Tax=Octopus sinensis TaxID=2607531 RepID=A0A7E6EHL5_9MOLL|nr:probable serine carboxypeptidase CPVL [Octopus sinensis]
MSTRCRRPMPVPKTELALQLVPARRKALLRAKSCSKKTLKLTHSDRVINGDLTPYLTFFFNLTGLRNYFNYIPTYYEEWLFKNGRMLNVGKKTFNDSKRVEMALVEDFMQSVTPLVQTIINNSYKCFFFNGQLDLTVPFPMTSEFLSKMDWLAKDSFMHSAQWIWYSQGESRVVNGCVRNYLNAYQVVVRSAGYMVPANQPQDALEMIDNFIYGLEF